MTIKRTLRRISKCSALCVFGLAAFLAGGAEAGTFSVNSIDDQGDNNVGDGNCRTGDLIFVGGSVPIFAHECTLRAALEEANDASDVDTINFSSLLPKVAGVVEIRPESPLPPLVGPVTIDGYSHPDYDDADPLASPIVNLVGNLAGSTPGLAFLDGSSGSIARGLAISNFEQSGIVITSFFSAPAPGNITIQGNHLGISRGVFYQGNDLDGIIVHDSNGNRIGQTCTSIAGCGGKGNLIAANGRDGVRLSGTSSINHIAGNYIGTDKFGQQTFVSLGGSTPNGEWGVRVMEDADENSIGSLGGFLALELRGGAGSTATAIASGNLISGNQSGGIYLESAFNTVYANRIGTDIDGIDALPNLGGGIIVSGDDTTIGNSGVGSNLISGNQGDGIRFESEFGGDPLRVTISGNRIGVNESADATLGNSSHGILTWGGQHDINHNVIGGNGGNGLHDVATNSSITSNFFGTNSAGSDLGNIGAGIELSEGNQTIGGVDQGNTFGFNLFGILANTSSYNLEIYGNYIGTNPGGDNLGNDHGGIVIQASNYDIGHRDGLVDGHANTIGWNGGFGIRVEGFDPRIRGNYIGTDAIGRVLPNTTAGVLFHADTSPTSRIGAARTTPDADVPRDANRIAHNARGIWNVSSMEVTFRGNEFSSNFVAAIVNGATGGLTPNDPGDADTGANQLQNTPDINPGFTFFDESTGDLEIRYIVDSSALSAAYPITVDFYIHDPWLNPGEQVGAYLGSDVYLAANAQNNRTTTLSPPLGAFELNEHGFHFGGLRATATDADGNTSELSLQAIPVPEPSAISMITSGALLCLARQRGRGRRGHSRRHFKP